MGQMNIRITRKVGVACLKNRCQSIIVSNIREYCALTPIFVFLLCSLKTGVRTIAVPRNNYGRTFSAIIPVITGWRAVHGHEI